MNIMSSILFKLVPQPGRNVQHCTNHSSGPNTVGSLPSYDHKVGWDRTGFGPTPEHIGPGTTEVKDLGTPEVRPRRDVSVTSCCYDRLR